MSILMESISMLLTSYSCDSVAIDGVLKWYQVVHSSEFVKSTFDRN